MLKWPMDINHFLKMNLHGYLDQDKPTVLRPSAGLLMEEHGSIIKSMNFRRSYISRYPYALVQTRPHAEKVSTLSGHCGRLCDPTFYIARKH